MDIIQFFFLSLFALSGVQGTAFQKALISKESVEKRKNMPIVKNNKFIGIKLIDEAHLVPDLPEFIKKLKTISENKNIEGFAQLLSDSVRCEGPDPNTFKKGKKACLENIKKEKDFWRYLKSSLEAGGCVQKKKYFVMPSISFCHSNEKLMLQLINERFFNQPLKVYYKPNVESKFYILPAHHFFKASSISKKECDSFGAKKCNRLWRKVNSSSGRTGYILRKAYPSESGYSYGVRIEELNGGFKVTSIMSAFPLY